MHHLPQRHPLLWQGFRALLSKPRPADLSGVKFIRSYVSINKEDPETKNVTIRYATADEGVKEEEFDLVVLSVGLNPPVDVDGLADKFGVELEGHHGFCKNSLTNPMQTSRRGVFVSGNFTGPTDIPESVFSASGAGLNAASSGTTGAAG